MTMQTIPNFTHVETHHCVTGSLRHLYLAAGIDVSEELLLGLGEGVGFMYWHQKGQPPFIGGRGVPKPSLEEIAGARTGVVVTGHTTASAAKAEKALLAALAADQPVMLQVDMGFLPYLDFGGEAYHFGGHVVVACGYDPANATVLIADRDADLHPVSVADVAAARGSTFKPFPPKHKWWTFDFAGYRLPTRDEILTAIAAQTDRMLNPPIRNFGIAGIRKAATMIPTWPDHMDEPVLRMTVFNAYIFISPVGGTGGGAFRYMFSRFLAEAATLTGVDDLQGASQRFGIVADAWAAVGDWFKAQSEADQLQLADVCGMLERIAELESGAWGELDRVVRRHLERETSPW